MYIDFPTAVGTGLLLADNRNRILPWLKKLHHWILNGRVRIAIFGPGGVGKTTLGYYLSGGHLSDFHDQKYQESINIEKYSFDGNVICDLLVPPGQARRQEYTWTRLFQSLASGEVQGIINIVSAGYHSFSELSYQETQYYQEDMSIEDFVQAYRQSSMQRELDVIERLTPRLCDAKADIWMITLVTKQDLWWDQRESVKQHYMEGEYNQFIEQIKHQRGSQNFAHEYLSASLVMSNMVTPQNEVLASTVAGYDQNIQFANLQKLNEMIDTFVEKR